MACWAQMPLLGLWIILFEDCHSLFEQSVLMVLDERGADAKTLLMRAGGDEADS